MNIFNALKQFKSLQESLNRFKEELERETVTYEDENFKIVSNLTGEVLELRIKSENCERLEENLLKALKELNRRVKEKVKEKAQNSLLGSLGLF
jgi:DNA-binding protein YbaB